MPIVVFGLKCKKLFGKRDHVFVLKAQHVWPAQGEFEYVVPFCYKIVCFSLICGVHWPIKFQEIRQYPVQNLLTVWRRAACLSLIAYSSHLRN